MYTHTHTQICHFFSLFYGTYACRHKTETPVNGTNPPCTLTDQSGLLLAVTNKKPTQASITKVKQFEGSTSFVRRSQWMLEQLRQVNGIDPNRVSELSSAEPRCPSLTVTLSLTLADWCVSESFLTRLFLCSSYVAETF